MRFVKNFLKAPARGACIHAGSTGFVNLFKKVIALLRWFASFHVPPRKLVGADAKATEQATKDC